jgi:multidrug efflux pump subunit AcrA (membrane-fusion protein)
VSLAARSAAQTFIVPLDPDLPIFAFREGRLPPGLAVPASALTQESGRPAVWVVDPQNHTVSLRDVEVLRYDPAAIVISQGLETGELVVTAGV